MRTTTTIFIVFIFFMPLWNAALGDPQDEIEAMIKVEEANIALKAKEYAKALKLYEQAMRHFTIAPDEYGNAAYAAFKAREFVKAKGYIRQALLSATVDQKGKPEYKEWIKLAAKIEREVQITNFEKDQDADVRSIVGKLCSALESGPFNPTTVGPIDKWPDQFVGRWSNSNRDHRLEQCEKPTILRVSKSLVS